MQRKRRKFNSILAQQFGWEMSKLCNTSYSLLKTTKFTVSTFHLKILTFWLMIFPIWAEVVEQVGSSTPTDGQWWQYKYIMSAWGRVDDQWTWMVTNRATTVLEDGWPIQDTFCDVSEWWNDYKVYEWSWMNPLQVLLYKLKDELCCIYILIIRTKKA